MVADAQGKCPAYTLMPGQTIGVPHTDTAAKQRQTGLTPRRLTGNRERSVR
jgi:hypothetical protein